MVNHAIQERRRKSIFRQQLISLLIRTIMFFGVLIYVFTQIFGIAVIESNDMYPEVRSGDMIIYYRNADYMNADVVLYKEKDWNVGRIEAVNGSVIDVTGEGQITIDGNIQPVQARMGLYSKTYKVGNLKYPYTVAENEYFILGDDRENATDSRVYGCIKESDIKGKVFTIIRRRAL